MFTATRVYCTFMFGGKSWSFCNAASLGWDLRPSCDYADVNPTKLVAWGWWPIYSYTYIYKCSTGIMTNVLFSYMFVETRSASKLLGSTRSSPSVSSTSDYYISFLSWSNFPSTTPTKSQFNSTQWLHSYTTCHEGFYIAFTFIKNDQCWTIRDVKMFPDDRFRSESKRGRGG